MRSDSYEAIIQSIKEKAYNTWIGEEGNRRANKVEMFINKKMSEYAEKLGFTKVEILTAIERVRNCNVVNYYQEINLPSLNSIVIYQSKKALYEDIEIKQGFRCPSCSGISKKPYRCTCDKCDWNAGGIFRTLGKGYRFTVKDTFLENPIVDEIFMPVCKEVDNV